VAQGQGVVITSSAGNETKLYVTAFNITFQQDVQRIYDIDSYKPVKLIAAKPVWVIQLTQAFASGTLTGSNFTIRIGDRTWNNCVLASATDEVSVETIIYYSTLTFYCPA